MDQINHTSSKRPFFVTVLCSFFFVFWSINFISIIATILIRMVGGQSTTISDIFNQISLIFTSTQIAVSWMTWLIIAGLIAGIVGYWLNQKWSVIVYAAATLALFIVNLPAGSSAPNKSMYFALILYVIATVFSLNIAMIVVGIKYFKQMK